MDNIQFSNNYYDNCNFLLSVGRELKPTRRLLSVRKNIRRYCVGIFFTILLYVDGTSCLKMWLISTGLSLLLVVAVLSAGLMWPYYCPVLLPSTTAQWNASSVDAFRGQEVPFFTTGICTDPHTMDNAGMHSWIC